jgi:tartrate dehydratase beta subunit/fumarate hydratase class I family protein
MKRQALPKKKAQPGGGCAVVFDEASNNVEYVLYYELGEMAMKQQSSKLPRG